MIINIREGESQEDFIKRARELTLAGTPPPLPGWVELMNKISDEVAREKEQKNGDS